MLALTADRKELEGDLGEFTGQSSRVTCAVDFCGPTDLTLPLMQGKAAEIDDPAVAGLVGSPIKEHLDVARSASPINYVTKDAAPLLIAHGTNDLRVNFEQSKTLFAALEKVGAPVWLIPVTDGGHSMGGGQELTARVQAFLDRYLRDEKNDLSTTPIPTQPETKKP
jgi:acetyl esterase/lipase